MTNLKAKSRVRSVIAKDLDKFNSEPPVKRKYVKRDKTIVIGSNEPIKKAKRKYVKRSDEIETGRDVIVHLAKDGKTVKNVFIDEDHASQVLNLAKEEIKRSLNSDKSTHDLLVTIPLRGAFNQRKIERLARKKIKEVMMKKTVTKSLTHIDFSKVDTRILSKISKLINSTAK